MKNIRRFTKGLFSFVLLAAQSGHAAASSNPQTQGLGLLGGFELGNGASVLDSSGGDVSAINYQFDSCLRPHHKGYRPISCIKSFKRAANDAGWRVAA